MWIGNLVLAESYFVSASSVASLESSDLVSGKGTATTNELRVTNASPTGKIYGKKSWNEFTYIQYEYPIT